MKPNTSTTTHVCCYCEKTLPESQLHFIEEEYACINLLNYNTVEFKIFRGTLKLNTLLATLQLVNKICDLATCLSDDEIQNVSWTTFAKSCTSPELVQYLKERQIYVNEPVTIEEEI